MLSNYVCLKNDSFDLDDKCFAVDKQLAKTIEILNKKGYYTEICSKASIFHAFLVSNIFHDLMEEKLIIVDKQTKEKLINLINHFDYESTIILFKEKYPFLFNISIVLANCLSTAKHLSSKSNESFFKHT